MWCREGGRPHEPFPGSSSSRVIRGILVITGVTFMGRMRWWDRVAPTLTSGRTSVDQGPVRPPEVAGLGHHVEGGLCPGRVFLFLPGVTAAKGVKLVKMALQVGLCCAHPPLTAAVGLEPSSEMEAHKEAA